MPPKKKTEGESISTKKDGKITINIPLSSFIKEHKNLSNVLESGIQDAILREAEAQRKELKNIINQVKEIQGLEKSKVPKATATMETQTMEEPKPKVAKPAGIRAMAPDLTKLQKK
jgi:hypothetical protein